MAASPRPSAAPLRLLTAVPVCDGHDSAVTTINLELARHGLEVIYLGYHQAASTIVRAAIQEDVNAIGLSSYNGGHLVFFREVVDQLKACGSGDIPVFGGGGGTITHADERVMKRQGTDRIYFAGTPLDTMMDEIKRRYARAAKPNARFKGDRALARAITLAEAGRQPSTINHQRLTRQKRDCAFVVGVAGPGGAGKSTLIDELTSRFLRANPAGRIALLANDPSHPGSGGAKSAGSIPQAGGAILGDRVSAIYAQDDRVFFRSLATRGSLTGLSAAAPAAIDILRDSGEFDLILVESVGVGQESDPFNIFHGRKLVDAVLFVLAPHYGGRIQLQKIALLNGADLVALNKCDHPMAHTAKAEIQARLDQNGKDQLLHATTAARHFDPGVDRLFTALAQRAGLDLAKGSEKACSMPPLH